MENILAGHVECTCRRMMAQEVVFATIDGTEYNYDTKRVTNRDMGYIGRNQAHTSRGLVQYATLVHTAGGLPLEILKLAFAARNFRKPGDPRPSHTLSRRRRTAAGRGPAPRARGGSVRRAASPSTTSLRRTCRGPRRTTPR